MIYRRVFFQLIGSFNTHSEQWLKSTCLTLVPVRLNGGKKITLKNDFVLGTEYIKAREDGNERQACKSENVCSKESVGQFTEERNRSKRRIVSSDLLSNENSYPDRKYRKRSQARKQKKMFSYKGEILFGVHPVYLALLQKKRRIYSLIVKNDASILKEQCISHEKIIKIARISCLPISYVNSEVFKSLVPGSVHQGICLDAECLPVPVWNENENCVETDKVPIWVVLDGILDPMNVGAIIRSAYYFGVNKLFITKRNSCRLSPVVSKASSGTLEIMNIFHLENLVYFLKSRRDAGWEVISTLAFSENKIENFNNVNSTMLFNLSKPTVLIFGTEGKGISESILSLCDRFISIEPKQNLHKGIDSLNVSVAAGIILYSLSISKQIKG